MRGGRLVERARLFAIDLPGFGASERSDAFALAEGNGRSS